MPIYPFSFKSARKSAFCDILIGSITQSCLKTTETRVFADENILHSNGTGT